eukprot:TCONS_00041325-protein
MDEWFQTNHYDRKKLGKIADESSNFREAARRIMDEILTVEEFEECAVKGQGPNTTKRGLPPVKLAIIKKYANNKRFGTIKDSHLHTAMGHYLVNVNRPGTGRIYKQKMARLAANTARDENNN